MTKFEILRSNPNSVKDYLERLLSHSYLLVLAIFTFGPYALMLSISFMGNSWQPTTPPKIIPEIWSLKHYLSLFTNFKFERYLINSLIYAGGTTLLVLVVDSLAGYAFARLEFTGRDITFGLILTTMMISPMVLIIPTFILFSQVGLVNTYIGVILPHAITGLGVFLMRQFIKTLPTSLEDAALIDGCSKFDIYWRIVLPMMKPALVTLALITFITTWNSFLWPLVLARTARLYPLTVALGFFQGQVYTNWSNLMAATTLTMAPVVILFVSMQKQYVRGFRVGGMKGE
jgi:ABC-type glycerol-3-phosphate transport system permease component